jgi:putative glutamine amidotransferase
MKIAISQREIVHNNITYDCLEHGWYGLLNHCDIEPIPNVSNIPLDFDMLILSGGDATPNRTHTETMYYNIALLKGIPILGVCHGAFFINEFHSGINLPIDGHDNTAHEIELDGNINYVNSHHTNSIGKLGIDLMPVATCPHDGTIEAFKHSHLPIWGLVWHPERTEGILLDDLAKVLYG